LSLIAKALLSFALPVIYFYYL